MKPDRISPRLDRFYKEIRNDVSKKLDSQNTEYKGSPQAQQEILEVITNKLTEGRKTHKAEINMFFQTCELGLTVASIDHKEMIHNYLNKHNIKFKHNHYITFRFKTPDQKQYFSDKVPHEHVSLKDIPQLVYGNPDTFLPKEFRKNPSLAKGARVTLALNEQEYLVGTSNIPWLSLYLREKVLSDDRQPEKDSGFFVGIRDELGNDTIGGRAVFREGKDLLNALRWYMMRHGLRWKDIDNKGKTFADKEFPTYYDEEIYTESIEHAQELNKIYRPEEKFPPEELKGQMMPGVFYADHKYNRVFPFEMQFFPYEVDVISKDSLRHDKYKKRRKVEILQKQKEIGVDLVFPQIVQNVKEFYGIDPIIL